MGQNILAANKAFQAIGAKARLSLNADVQHEKMKEICIVILAVACIGCGRSNPPQPPAKNTSPSDSAIEAITGLAASNVYAAGEYWDNLRNHVNFASEADTAQWLVLQQALLTNTMVPESIQRSAIQEFYTHYEQARPFSEWLRRSQDKGLFKDPFITQNIEMTLGAMDETKKNENAEQGVAPYAAQGASSGER